MKAPVNSSVIDNIAATYWTLTGCQSKGLVYVMSLSPHHQIYFIHPFMVNTTNPGLCIRYGGLGRFSKRAQSQENELNGRAGRWTRPADPGATLITATLELLPP